MKRTPTSEEAREVLKEGAQELERTAEEPAEYLVKLPLGYSPIISEGHEGYDGLVEIFGAFHMFRFCVMRKDRDCFDITMSMRSASPRSKPVANREYTITGMAGDCVRLSSGRKVSFELVTSTSVSLRIFKDE